MLGGCGSDAIPKRAGLGKMVIASLGRIVAFCLLNNLDEDNSTSFATWPEPLVLSDST